MEVTAVRPRYARHTVPGRRYKRNARDNGALLRTIARQLVIALFLLLVAGLLKSINTPATNFLSDKVRFVLTQNIELTSVYDYIDKAFVSLKNSIAPQTVPENTNSADVSDKSAAADISGKPTAAAAENKPETSVLSATYDKNTEELPKMLTPVNGVLSSEFGERKDPFTGSLKFHEGIDIEAVKGADICAALDGTVLESGSSSSYGNYIKLGHTGGYETVYAHCSSLNAEKGMTVKQGAVIAKVGDSGASVGVHLHFEVRKDGKPVNPLEYIVLAAGENQT